MMMRWLVALALLWGLGSSAARAQEDAPTLYNKGVGLANAGQVEQAADAFRQAIAADPTLALAHYNLGVAMQKLKRHDEALPAFQEAARLDPAYAPAFMNTGATYQAMGKSAEAAAAYREAVRLAPDDTEAQFGLCWMLLADNRTAEAQAEYANLARLSQSRADALYNDYKARAGTTPPPEAQATTPPAVTPAPEASLSPSAAPASPASAALPAAASPASPAAPVTVAYGGAPGSVSRYKAIERTTVATRVGAQSVSVQTSRELIYVVRITPGAYGVVTREITLESQRVTRGGQPVKLPQPAVARSELKYNGENAGKFSPPPARYEGIEPVLCRPRLPAIELPVGSEWSHAQAPVPGTFPPVEVRMAYKLDRLESVGGAACVRVTIKGTPPPMSRPEAGSARLSAVVLWDLAGKRLSRMRGRGVSEDTVSRTVAGAAVQVPRKISYELAVDLVP